MRIVIFGASGRTGRILTEQALQAGVSVTAVTRRRSAFPLEHPLLRVLEADVEAAGSLRDALTGQDAVISVLGVPYGRRPITVYSRGVAAILEAMHAAGVRRLVCVSSTAVEPRYRQGGLFFERVLKPLIAATLGRTTYADQRRMEQLVSASDIDWTIVRPSGLFDTPSVNEYTVLEGFDETRKFTARADLADCLLREVSGPGHPGAVVAVSTVSQTPSLLKVIAREAFHRGAAPQTPSRSAA
jgi:nucleoside-diphosphate-sugar epimerase